MNVIVQVERQRKTTLLNVLSASIPSDERIRYYRGRAEIQLSQDHVITWKSPYNTEGRGQVKIRDLVEILCVCALTG